MGVRVQPEVQVATTQANSSAERCLRGQQPPSLTAPKSVCLLVVLPILDYNRLLYIYSCLPLHFLEEVRAGKAGVREAARAVLKGSPFALWEAMHSWLATLRRHPV